MKKIEDYNTPIFWAEGHPGKLIRENWEIKVHGKCKNPQVFTWVDLQKLKKTTVEGRLTSVTRWSVQGFWGGVSLADIASIVQPDSTVKYVRFWSVNKIYDTSIPIRIAKQEKTILAWEFNEHYLSEDYGGPVRIFCPYLWGYKSAKSVVEIDFLDHYIPGFWEKRGYTDSGKIEAGKVRDLNDNGKVKSIPEGEVIEFIEKE